MVLEKVIAALEELREINHIYDISTDTISQLMKEIDGAKVCTPIIGKFSSGKSALVNTILGYTNKILRKISRRRLRFRLRLYIQNPKNPLRLLEMTAHARVSRSGITEIMRQTPIQLEVQEYSCIMNVFLKGYRM